MENDFTINDKWFSLTDDPGHGMTIRWIRNGHDYRIESTTGKTFRDLVNGDTTDTDWILSYDNFHIRNVGGIVKFLRDFVLTHPLTCEYYQVMNTVVNSDETLREYGAEFISDIGIRNGKPHRSIRVTLKQ